jgi:hypothetical protein
MRRSHRNSLADALPLFSNADDVAYAADRYGGLADELPDAADRALRAGARAPLRYLGAGANGIVFCDARKRGYKVARSRETFASLADEAEWLSVASADPTLRNHVAKFRAWHPTLGVIERECVQAQDREKVRTWGLDDKRWNLHRMIGRVMRQYGWSAPEYKDDSYIVTRDRGLVLVDAGYVLRLGSRLAREVAATHRDPSASAFDRDFSRGTLRSEYGRTIPRTAGERLHERLAALPNGNRARRRSR